MTFEEFLRAPDDHLFIIAEAGVNHDGDLEKAFKLVDAAVAAGADAVKFQAWITEKVYSAQSLKPDYQKRTTDQDESEFDTIKALEFGHEEFAALSDYCRKQGIVFFATPDEADSADALVELGVPLLKTASQDVTNLPFLRHLATYGLPVIYSTGASTLNELVAGAEVFLGKVPGFAILHCVSAYPAPMADMNLRVISTLRKMFPCVVGFSDHTDGASAACAALALGARVFEKHLTLDRSAPGPDHQASLDPDQFTAYVRELHDVLTALGDGHKRIMPSEENTRLAFRRFIVAARGLPAGTVLTEADLLFKKVVDGLPPNHIDQVVGARLRRDVDADAAIDLSMLEWD